MAGGGGTKTPAKPGAAKPTKEGGRAGRNIPGASAEEEAKTYVPEQRTRSVYSVGRFWKAALL